jgi:hypothetical protein
MPASLTIYSNGNAVKITRETHSWTQLRSSNDYLCRTRERFKPIGQLSLVYRIKASFLRTTLTRSPTKKQSKALTHKLYPWTERSADDKLIFYVLLTVHLSIILVNDQLDAQLFFLYVYFSSLHVSSNLVLIIRRGVSTQHPVCVTLCRWTSSVPVGKASRPTH